MPISDKTRKMLWGKSGNRCSFCKLELIIDATDKDDPSIVGEECHIVSGQINGPRYDVDRPSDEIDSYENLILLCRVHHKMIDDQFDTFTESIIKQLKQNHELWVSERLAQKEHKEENPLKVKRIKENIPKTLPRITTGKEVISILDLALGYQFDHDEPNNEKEVELISGFLQYLHDLGDLLSDFESGERVRYGFEITQMIKELLDIDYYVFGSREIRVLEGGKGSPSSFPIAIINVKHKNNLIELSKNEADSQE